jgi:hypothetical protein
MAALFLGPHFIVIVEKGSREKRCGDQIDTG